MKGYIVTLLDMERSVKVADRCIESCARFGVDARKFQAVPKEIVASELLREGLKVGRGDEAHSDPNAILANFVSQFRIWREILTSGEAGIVFEHDAVMVAKMPDVSFRHVMNIGKPSFGRFIEGKSPGVHPFFSKKGGYFGGAHAYAVNPSGAQLLIEKAREIGANPCDLFLNLENFPWLDELYPWVAEAHDSFSTIQKKQGCIAKHRFGKGYDHL